MDNNTPRPSADEIRLVLGAARALAPTLTSGVWERPDDVVLRLCAAVESLLEREAAESARRRER